MRITPGFKNYPVRYKILAACLAIFIPFALAIGALAYSLMQRALERHIDSELANTTATIRNMVQTSVHLSVRSYLRSVAETNLKLVRGIHSDFLQSGQSEEEAKKRAARLILSQKIGHSGYLYAIDSLGNAIAHPDPQVQGRNFAATGFVAEQMNRKNGYIEYEWKNPGEKDLRNKALSMAYFEPWDWIISATAYRSEFGALVDVADFKANVGSLRFGKSGYSYILDLQGNLIVHPVFEGRNGFEVGEGDKEFLRDIINTREGRKIYRWRNPGEADAREKLVVYDFIPEVDWIVASSAYLDDIYEPLIVFRDNSLLMGLLSVALGVFLAFRVSASITGPVSRLTRRLSGGGGVALPESGDEIEKLSALFDRFMERLEIETSERQQAESLLRSSQERYRAVMEAAPDPIMVLDLDAEVLYVNQAFLNLFKWRTEELKGREGWRAIVPQEDQERAGHLARRILDGGTVGGIEAVRCARDGAERQVVVSGGPFRDGAGNIAGGVVIYRDITEFRKMEREVINADEHERIRIGQDLHDDLAPHLIGIEVMCQVFKKKLSAEKSPHVAEAGKIQHLVSEAITKTRALARGLSPVHLAEEGLQMGLSQLLEMVGLVFGVRCELRWEGGVNLDATTSVHLYRIVQEALHNAIKHANADNMAVECEGDMETFRIAIIDDGVGMGNPAEKRGMGMKIMAFRARMIGALLDFSTPPEGGTRVVVTLRNLSFPLSLPRDPLQHPPERHSQ